MKNNPRLTNKPLLSANANQTSQHQVAGQYNGAISMDSAKIDFFKKINEMRFASFLKNCNSIRLKLKPGFETLGDFADETLERKFMYCKAWGPIFTERCRAR
ncbi:Protein of unknown function [Cotesia congregata]|uniref:Uncharacterized protein n=1 Tax=Cotesia congregata TaxID=51543 RepID=A0A8J2HQ50_COTCN|nr:Protein of unknown function [Cotesia congregata]